MMIAIIGFNTKEKAYEVTFNTNGHGTQPEEFTKVTVLPELPNLQEEGYHFIGWYFDETFLEEAKEGMQITEDKILYALWGKVYRVEFEINGHGTKPDAIKDVTKLPKLSVLQEEGFNFIGWYLDEQLTIAAIEGAILSSDVKVYAKWEEIIKTYEVSFENNEHGSVQQKLTEVTQLPDTLPVLTEEGYRFDGWFLDEAFKTPAVSKMVLEEDVTLYAKWTKLYHIAFEINGHGESIEEIKDVLALPNEFPVLEEEGYKFDGWFLDEDFTIPAVENADIQEDTILYAKWELEGFHYIEKMDELTKKNLSVDGYAQYGITDFTQYWNTDAYRKVSTPLEFLTALVDAKYDYTNTWNEETKTFEQTLNKAGSVHVIEIVNDLNLGYFKMGSKEKATNLVTDFASKMNNLSSYLCMSDMLKENGNSQIKLENTSNLLIYYKTENFHMMLHNFCL